MTAQAINSESLAAPEGRDIWTEAKTDAHRRLLFGPEAITTDEFDNFINYPMARSRIGYFVIDEIHLVDEWGPELGVVYATLFTVMSRPPEWVVMVGLTATLEPGRQKKAVVKVLGSRVRFPSRNTIVSVMTSTSSFARFSATARDMYFGI